MTPKQKPSNEDQHLQTLEEICENTRAIRRVTNRILDYLHQRQDDDNGYDDPDAITWEDLYDNDDMYL